MSDATQDRRRFQRIAFDAQTELVLGEKVWPVQLHDLSLKGLLVTCPSDWQAPAAEVFLARIRLAEDVLVEMEVAPAHVEGDHLGLVCRKIDLESISHLRRLVELNIGDSELLERELEALGNPQH